MRSAFGAARSIPRQSAYHAARLMRSRALRAASGGCCATLDRAALRDRLKASGRGTSPPFGRRFDGLRRVEQGTGLAENVLSAHVHFVQHLFTEHIFASYQIHVHL